jgi:radical SAM protein with 4Fe4S-binding SPASM domain
MSQGKFPYFIDWAITAKCNLSCRHCRGMAEEGLSPERAERLVHEIAGLKPEWVIIEGGEPLLRQDLFSLLALMQQKQLETHLISNGMLLTPEIISRLKGLGVRLMISIDGATPATYESIRQGASFARVVESARQCAQEGLLEAINFTILKQNYAEIPAIMALARSIGVPRVTFIGLKPCQYYPEELLTPEQYGEAIRLACQAAEETGVEFYFDEPFFWVVVREWGLSAKMPSVGTGILFPATTACIFGEYLFIEPSGEVKPCSFAHMVVGNVNEKPLGEIWQGVLASPFFRRIKEQESRSGYCRSCKYFADCMGCRSRTFILTGDWFAADPCCPLSLKLAAKEG